MTAAREQWRAWKTSHSVKITDGDWAWHSDLIAGVDWVAANAQKLAVMNLSYDGSTDLIALSLERALQKRVIVVKAAGNEHESACTDESNEVHGVIVVGSTDSSDNRSSFSDYGPCLSLFAPGVGVRGASFSAPYVAGIAATMLEQRPQLTSHQVEAYLQQTSWAGMRVGGRGSGDGFKLAKLRSRTPRGDPAEGNPSLRTARR